MFRKDGLANSGNIGYDEQCPRAAAKVRFTVKLYSQGRAQLFSAFWSLIAPVLSLDSEAVVFNAIFAFSIYQLRILSITSDLRPSLHQWCALICFYCVLHLCGESLPALLAEI